MFNSPCLCDYSYMFLKILQLVPEALPTFVRTVLFGKYLPRHQVVCDLVGTADSAPFQEQNFSLGAAPSLSRRYCLRREWSFIRAAQGRGDCHIIQVRDRSACLECVLPVSEKFHYPTSQLQCQGRIEKSARHQLARLRAAAGERIVGGATSLRLVAGAKYVFGAK